MAAAGGCLRRCSAAALAAGIFLVATGGLIFANRVLHAHGHGVPVPVSSAEDAAAPGAAAAVSRPGFAFLRRGARLAASSRSGGPAGGPLVHVVFCTDDRDFRGLVVAILSSLQHVSAPARLRFHVFTSESVAPLMRTTLFVRLPGVPIDVRHDTKLQEHIKTVVQFVRHTWTDFREEWLLNAFNYVPFYLPRALSNESEGIGMHPDGSVSRQAPITTGRILYLEADVVVLSDLVALFDSIDLQGRAVATAVDCRWRYGDLFNSNWLRKRSYNPKACAPQRGIVVIDIDRWTAQKLSEDIEGWLSFTRKTQHGFFQTGVPPSAWLLALKPERFVELDQSWGCNGLGRSEMTSDEGWALRHSGFDKAAFAELEVEVDRERGNSTPFVAECTGNASLLHFNGELKPWTQGIWRKKKPAPVCAIPKGHEVPSSLWRRTVTLYGHTYVNLTRGRKRKLTSWPRTFVRCYEVWKLYISDDLSCALSDISREWGEDERIWQDHLRQENKKNKKRAEKAVLGEAGTGAKAAADTSEQDEAEENPEEEAPEERPQRNEPSEPEDSSEKESQQEAQQRPQRKKSAKAKDAGESGDGSKPEETQDEAGEASEGGTPEEPQDEEAGEAGEGDEPKEETEAGEDAEDDAEAGDAGEAAGVKDHGEKRPQGAEPEAPLAKEGGEPQA